MQAKKNYIIGIFIIMGILAGYLSIRLYHTMNTQTISIYAVTKGATEKEDAVSGGIKLHWEGEIVPKKKYRIVIHYDVVEKKSDGLLWKKSDAPNKASLVCCELKTEKTFTATQKFLDVELMLAISPENVVDENGNPFNPDGQMLCPVMDIKEISGINE